MAITKKKLIKTKKTTIRQREPIDPVTFAEYLRRKNAREQKKDKTAPIIYFRSLQNAVEHGFIPVYVFGNAKFVDWAESKDYVFRTCRTEQRQKTALKK